jgi:hypothetical protein
MSTTSTAAKCGAFRMGLIRGLEIRKLVEDATGAPCPCKQGLPCPLAARA